MAALERIHPSLSVLYSPADWESINLYIPGCVEHYLVHTMREHDDFIQELDFVLELDGVVIGYIMYTKAALTDDDGNVKNILTFGPL